jgi:hypothetical protein
MNRQSYTCLAGHWGIPHLHIDINSSLAGASQIVARGEVEVVDQGKAVVRATYLRPLRLHEDCAHGRLSRLDKPAQRAIH